MFDLCAGSGYGGKKVIAGRSVNVQSTSLMHLKFLSVYKTVRLALAIILLHCFV